MFMTEHGTGGYDGTDWTAAGFSIAPGDARVSEYRISYHIQYDYTFH